jgi:HEPN domain-containing protein
MNDWKTALQREFEMAENARARGNEGQARVCARRAAGIALRETFRRRGMAARSSSAYDLLGEFMGLDETPADLREIAGYLTLRVTEEFKLPLEVDLVEEARTLCERLLPGEITS